MYEELRERAVEKLEEEKEKRKGVYIVGYIFAAVSLVLLIVSSRFSGDTVFWTRFPIIILAFVYGIIYIASFGLPFLGISDDLTEEEIERTMAKIYKKTNLNKLAATEDEKLELKEIEQIHQKYNGDEDYV